MLAVRKHGKVRWTRVEVSSLGFRAQVSELGPEAQGSTEVVKQFKEASNIMQVPQSLEWVWGPTIL